MNMKTKTNENLIFSITYQDGHESKIIVDRFTTKSVFYRNYPAGRLVMRMSIKTLLAFRPVLAL